MLTGAARIGLCIDATHRCPTHTEQTAGHTGGGAYVRTYVQPWFPANVHTELANVMEYAAELANVMELTCLETRVSLLAREFHHVGQFGRILHNAGQFSMYVGRKPWMDVRTLAKINNNSNNDNPGKLSTTATQHEQSFCGALQWLLIPNP